MPARADRTRDRIFAAAAELIGERGFHGTTVDDIVARAGVAKGTIYYHFKSKEALFDGLLTEHFGHLSDAFSAAVDAASGPADALRALVLTELDYIHANQAASKVLMSEVWRSDRAWCDTLRPLRDRYVAVLRTVLEDGVAADAFRPDLDTNLAASALFGMTATVALDWLVFDPERQIDQVASEVTSLVMRSVSA
jgi:AcrR family transcriptional regulator